MRKMCFVLWLLVRIWVYGGGDLLYRWSYIAQPSVSSLNPENWLRLDSKMQGMVGVFLWGKWSFFDDRMKIKISDYMRVYPTAERVELTNCVNEGYVCVSPCDWLLLTVGKEVIKNGVAYVRNPTDYFGQKISVMSISRGDFEKYREGMLVLDAQLIGERSSWQLVFVPRVFVEGKSGWEYILTSQETNSVLSTVKWNVGGVEIHSLAFYDGQWRGGVNMTYVFRESLELHCEGSVSERYVQYLLREGDVYAGPWVIGVTNTLEVKEIRWPFSFVVGGHYTLSDQKITIMVEYFYDGQGLCSKEWEKTLEYIRTQANTFSSTNMFSLASLQTIKSFVDKYSFGGFVQHYAMVRVSKEWGNHVEGEIVCLQNLVDWSGLLVHRLRKQEDDFQWDISFSFGYGNEKSEFGMMVDIFRLEAGMGFFF